MDNARKQLERLILTQADIAEKALRDTYNKVIATTQERVSILEERQKELWQQSAQVSAYNPQRAYDEIASITLDKFWKLLSTKINQLLHRLLGPWRFLVDAGEIVGVIDAPKRGKKQIKEGQ